MLDLCDFIDGVEALVQRHRLDGPGRYSRWTQVTADAARPVALNPYGVADAANILYTIGRFPRDPAERSAWIDTLRTMQDARCGLFEEATHHPFHTTAHCLAALELFDARPAHALTALRPLTEVAALETFLDGLDWIDNPWNASHQGAGLYAALVLADEAPLPWQDAYFDWLAREADPHTGYWRRGCVGPIDRYGGSLFPHLAGTFHYLFNHEHARRPLPYPQALIDACLDLYARGGWPSLGRTISFAEIDWVYCLTRALRQCGHRFADCRRVLAEFARSYVGYLRSVDLPTHPLTDDLHMLFGALCAVAELQQALPGTIRTPRPLKLVLDRRPFI